jgi:hypothetical protein
MVYTMQRKNLWHVDVERDERCVHYYMTRFLIERQLTWRATFSGRTIGTVTEALSHAANYADQLDGPPTSFVTQPRRLSQTKPPVRSI